MPEGWCAEIDLRASALGLTRASYLRLIVQRWRREGRPAVSEPDRLMQVSRKPNPGPPPAQRK